MITPTDRIKEIESIIKPLIEEKERLEQEIIMSKSTFKVGDVIEWNNGCYKGRVIKVLRWISDTPMWVVVRLRKDGTEGQQSKVYPWHDIKLAQ